MVKRGFGPALRYNRGVIKRLFIVIILLSATWWLLEVQPEKPSNDRNWSLDQAVPAEAVFSGDEVTIKNVRNFTYRSTTDYDPQYYDLTLNLNDLETVDYIVEPFGSIGAAHTFLSFGFSNGQQIAVSVEIRKEQGETFSPCKGMVRRYELMYVVADERDVVNLRANHRQHDVYLYPTTATKEGARRLFVDMLERANTLLREPEFYHTITNNCTVNIARHINKLISPPIAFDYRLILPAHSDALAMEYGFITPGMTLEEAREKYRINDLAREALEKPYFSRIIRGQ